MRFLLSQSNLRYVIRLYRIFSHNTRPFSVVSKRLLNGLVMPLNRYSFVFDERLGLILPLAKQVTKPGVSPHELSTLNQLVQTQDAAGAERAESKEQEGINNVVINHPAMFNGQTLA